MADPVTMTLVALTAAAAVKAVGELKEGQQQSATEKYNASVAEAQAGAVKTSAAFESETLTKQSELEQAKTTREKTKTLSEQRALYAKSGVRVDVGSPLDVMADTAANYELDLAANRYNLATGLETIRYGAETQTSQLSAEAQYRRQLAKSYKSASYLKAGSTLLTAAGSYGVMQGVKTPTTYGGGSQYTGSSGGIVKLAM
jgi:hypothetical protein